MRSSVGHSAFHDVATLSVIPVLRRREALSAPIGLAAHFMAGETGTCKHQLYILVMRASHFYCLVYIVKYAILY